MKLCRPLRNGRTGSADQAWRKATGVTTISGSVGASRPLTLQHAGTGRARAKSCADGVRRCSACHADFADRPRLHRLLPAAFARSRGVPRHRVRAGRSQARRRRPCGALPLPGADHRRSRRLRCHPLVRRPFERADGAEGPRRRHRQQLPGPAAARQAQAARHPADLRQHRQRLFGRADRRRQAAADHGRDRDPAQSGQPLRLLQDLLRLAGEMLCHGGHRPAARHRVRISARNCGPS